MEENSGNLTQVTPPQFQPSIPPNPTFTPSFQQQQSDNSLGVQITPTDKPKRLFTKKIIFLFIMPLVVIVIIFSLTVMKIGTGFIAQPKYLPSYLPSDIQKTGVKFEKNNNGENAYIVSYAAAGGGYLYFSQILNPVNRKCEKQPETNTKVKDYHEFLPTGSSEGCVHTTIPDNSSKILYFRWLKDGVWFELTTMNYDISDEEALKLANSIQIQAKSSN